MSAVAERNALLEQIANASGLARPFAVASIRRACTRAGIDPDRLTRAELTKALPHIKQVLEIYLQPEEVTDRMKQVEALAQW